jgi:hypothetical protein
LRPNYLPELREGAIRLVMEHRGDYPSRWAAIGNLPFLAERKNRIHAACLSFMAGVMPPRARLGRLLL